MQFTLSTPSKTFLLGEYLVLQTGEALIVNTGPRFSLHVNMVGVGKANGIHADSPAGQLIRKNAALFSSVNISFSDPHLELGGFGASSAQFLMTYYTMKILQRSGEVSRSTAFVREMHSAYLDLDQSREGARPSGADVVAQTYGDFSFMSLQDEVQCKTDHWPFAGYDLLLVRTGVKVATHEHLRGPLDIPVDQLKTVWNEAHAAWIEKQDTRFFTAMNAYSEVLEKHHLVAPSTLEILKKLKPHGVFTVARGCGAMGADVIALVFKTSDRESVIRILREMHLPQVASLTDVSAGLVAEGLEGNSLVKDLQS